MTPRYSRGSSQAGMVSILVTMVMMIVITLIVLGFAQIARREGRLTLDRQLSTQAFYAAETGINDAQTAILKALRDGTDVQEKTECETPSAAAPVYDFNPVIDADAKVSYSCMLVSTSLPTIKASLDTDNSTVVPIRPASNSIGTLNISWAAPATPASYSGCPATVGGNDLIRTTAWSARACGYGALRVDLVETTTLNRLALTGTETSFIFYPTRVPPTSPAANVTFGTGSRGQVASMSCGPNACTARISGLNGANRTFSMRLKALYSGGAVTLSATTGANGMGTSVLLKDAQAQIDVTGKAMDVLRRIQVRLSLIPSSKASIDYAIESGSSICKRFTVFQNFFSVPSDILDQDTSNPLCRSTPPPPAPPLPPVPPPSCAVPQDVILTLDQSSSMDNPWENGNTREDKQKMVAKEFVQNVGLSAAGIHVGVISFHTWATLEQRLTYSESSLINAIQRMQRDPGTQYIKGLQMTEDAFSVRLGARPLAKQTLVFISDGQPDSDNSDAEILRITDIFKRRGMTIYTIGIYPGDGNKGILQRMATSNNHHLAVDREKQLEDFLRKIANDIKCT